MGEAARSGRHPALRSAVLRPALGRELGRAARDSPGSVWAGAVPRAVSSWEGCPRGTGLAQEAVSHPARGGLSAHSLTGPSKLNCGLPTALPRCSVRSLLLLPFASSKSHFIVQTSPAERRRPPRVHAKPRTQFFHGRWMHTQNLPCHAGLPGGGTDLGTPVLSLQPGS